MVSGAWIPFPYCVTLCHSYDVLGQYYRPWIILWPPKLCTCCTYIRGLLSPLNFVKASFYFCISVIVLLTYLHLSETVAQQNKVSSSFCETFSTTKSYTFSALVVSKGLQIRRQNTNFQQQTCSTKYRTVDKKKENISTRYCSRNNVKNVRKC